jgi:hypothetical protein
VSQDGLANKTSHQSIEQQRSTIGFRAVLVLKYLPWLSNDDFVSVLDPDSGDRAVWKEAEYVYSQDWKMSNACKDLICLCTVNG